MTSIPSFVIVLSSDFTQFLPPDNNTVSEYFTLKDRLLSFVSTTGIGMIYLGSYNERLKGSYELSPQTTVHSNTLGFNICTSIVQLIIVIIVIIE